MAIRSGFFNSINSDRLYSATEFAEYFAAFIGSGVFPDPSTSLQIQATTGMIVKIKAGKAWINGFFMISDADTTETLTADAVLNRIDRYVVRLHYSNRAMTIVRKAGTAASSPVAPSVIRDAEMFELSLATIAVNAGASSILQGNITDTRSDGTVCGFVSSTITNLPYLTPSKVLISNVDGELAVSSVTSTEVGYLSGVSSALQPQLNSKQTTINGGASSIVSSNLSASKALVSDASGKVAVSSVSATELATIAGVTSAIQTQLNTKQATITGAISSLVNSNLTVNKATISDEFGKLTSSNVTSSELGFLSGVTSALQTQINGKLGTSEVAVDAQKIGGKKIAVSTSAPSNPAIGDIWIDTN
ncbi:MAG TPA: hypothetical protein VIK55_05055 [Paludibacter sp.]